MEIKDLVRDDRDVGVFKVHRSSMTSADIFELERERIFDRCWIYVGHESEMANPGDYRRRRVAGRPTFFVRGDDGQARVFLNSCPHRGSLVCRNDSGNATNFRCIYHGWTFNLQGDLIGLPRAEAYGPAVTPRSLGLMQVPRLASYRGFYFVSFNRQIVDLETYLAGAKDFLDLIVDQSEAGMRVIDGSAKYDIKANWKLLAENSLDSYHLHSAHRTYLDFISSVGTDDSGQSVADRPAGSALSLGNGHCVTINLGLSGRPIARWHPVFGGAMRKPIQKTRERLVTRFGEERAFRMADTSRNLLIYPNLQILDIVAITIRYFEPIATDCMSVSAWHLVPQGEFGDQLATRLASYLTFLGPGGFATPDDVEVLESCQLGFGAREMEWSDISRGMLNPSPAATDELQMRGFWRQWHAHMQGIEAVVNVQDAPPRHDKEDDPSHDGATG